MRNKLWMQMGKQEGIHSTDASRWRWGGSVSLSGDGMSLLVGTAGDAAAPEAASFKYTPP